MPNRTAKFVSALFASLLAGAPLTTVTHGATTVADDCLSGPKGQAPQGAHWYYRVDRSTKRHCWYLADQHTPRSQTTVANSPASTKPPQDAEAAMQQSVANAHAELPADGTRTEDSDNAATQVAPTQRSLVASRWPDPYSSAPEATASPARRDPGAGVTSTAQSQPTSVQFATADASSATSLYSLPLQLTALAGMLALAGIIGTVMFKFGRSPRLQSSEISNRRGHIWESTDDDRIALSDHPDTNRFARGRQQTLDRRDRTTEFFAQISRRAPT